MALSDFSRSFREDGLPFLDPSRVSCFTERKGTSATSRRKSGYTVV